MKIFPYQILMQMINFAILFFLLNKYLFTPLIKFLDKRERLIQQSIDEAKTNEIESKKLIDEQTMLLTQARSDIRQSRAEAEARLADERRQALENTKQEIRARLDRSEHELQQQVETAKKQVAMVSGDLVVSLTEKIVESDLTDKQRDRIAKRYLETVTG
jgi:F-type H+-transporting ATPase subunit b